MNLILEKSINFSKKDNKTNVLIDLDIDKNYDALTIWYEYSPKTSIDLEYNKKQINASIKETYPKSYELEVYDWYDFAPITNLITISLDDEKGNYVGCKHHQNPTDIYIISEEESSFGFSPTEISKGKWRLVLNVHGLFTGDDVTFNLKINGIGGF